MRRVPQIIMLVVIFPSKSVMLSNMVDTVSFENLGAFLISILSRSSSSHAIMASFRWGHFSTVWLVKDTQLVLILNLKYLRLLSECFKDALPFRSQSRQVCWSICRNGTGRDQVAISSILLRSNTSRSIAYCFLP